MRVGDRSVTEYQNEADGKKAARPRLFFSAPNQFTSRGAVRPWIVIVCVFAILATALVIRIVPSSPEPISSPLPLQTFVRPTTSPKASSPQKIVPEPLVRVNVTPGGVDSFQLELRGQCEMISLESKKTMSLKPLSGTINVTSTKTGLKLDAQKIATSRLEITPQESPSIRVNGHLYRGKIQLFRRTDGKVSAVNVLPIEEYLASVVDSEMPATFPKAAREAQSIVARTYALYQAEQADRNAVFDLLSSQRSQKYLGVEYVDGKGRRLAGESDSSRHVVASTRGMVCKQNDKLFCTYYSAVCGGQTTNGRSVFKDAIDSVQSVPCEWCRDSPHYRWTKEVSHDDFQKRILNQNEVSVKTAQIRSIRQEVGPGEGFVSKFKIDDGQRSHSVSGIELRERLPAGTLSSPHFFIKLEKDRVVFEGRGHGHGVGFCQWGAKGQAEANRTSLDIIRHYYPGVEIVTLNY